MAAKKRKSAPGELVVKASILIGAREHAIWSACASLDRVDRSAFAVKAIMDRCAGLTMIDRRKPADRPRISDRPDPEPCVSDPGPDPAA